MNTATKTREKSGQVQLTSHDVNVISAIVQQKSSLPKDFLIAHAKESKISADAIEIIEILLDDSFSSAGKTAPTTKKAARRNIADEFYRWARTTR